jgi:hypothetical protein
LSGGGVKNMVRESSSWETELWSYLRNSDGLHCPMHGSCQLEKSGNWCFNDELKVESLNNLHIIADSDDFNENDNDITEFQVPICTSSAKIFLLSARLADKCRKRNLRNLLPVPDDLILSDGEGHPIEVHRVPLKATHGAVWRLNDCWVVHLNSNDPSSRQRFTLYHEIFHILAHCHGAPMFKKQGDRMVYFNEMIADHFSARLLMPHEWISKMWFKTRDVKQMAEIFDVPRSIMYIGLRVENFI